MLNSNCHIDQPRNLVRRLRCAQEGRAVDVFQARVLQRDALLSSCGGESQQQMQSQVVLVPCCRGHAQQLVHLQTPGVPRAARTAHPKTHTQFVGLLQSAGGEGRVMWTLQAQ